MQKGASPEENARAESVAERPNDKAPSKQAVRLQRDDPCNIVVSVVAQLIELIICLVDAWRGESGSRLKRAALPADWSQPNVIMKTQKAPRIVSHAFIPPSGYSAASGAFNVVFSSRRLSTLFLEGESPLSISMLDGGPAEDSVAGLLESL